MLLSPTVCSNGNRIAAASEGSSDGDATVWCGPHSLQADSVMTRHAAARPPNHRRVILLRTVISFQRAVSADQTRSQDVISDDGPAPRQRRSGPFELMG